MQICYEAWSLLDKRLSPISKVHIRTLCDQLRSQEAFRQVHSIFSMRILWQTLASATSPLQESELVDYNLDDLSSDFKEFITSFNLRQSTSFDNLYDLIQEEQLPQKISSNSNSSGAALAVITSNPPKHQNCSIISGGIQLLILKWHSLEKKTTVAVWHSILGHPSNMVFRSLLNNFHLPVSGLYFI